MEPFLFELFVRGVVLCLLVAMALLLLRRAAAVYRHLLCVLALGGLLILPLAQRLLPPLPILKPTGVATPIPAQIPTEDSNRSKGRDSNAELPLPQEKPQMAMLQTGSATLALPNNAFSPPLATDCHQQLVTIGAVLLTIWGLGATTLLIRLVVALVRLRKIKASGCSETWGNLPILVSEQVETPLTWGIRNHVILMPQALFCGDPAICESALRHEQAHIARRDWIWNLLSEIVCALYWFQPGVWWLRRRMRMESERACDDRVLLSGIAGPDYAAHLLQILRSVRTHEVAPAMAHSGSMEERMQHILDTNRTRHAQTKWLAVSASLAVVLLSFTALRVSARPIESKADVNATALKSGRLDMPSQLSNYPLSAVDPGVPQPTDLPFSELPPISVSGHVPSVLPGTTMAQAQPETTLLQEDGSKTPAAVLPDPKAPLGHIVWGEAVDGLQTGFLLQTSGDLKSGRVAFNSRVVYHVLVRNTTDRSRTFLEQCQNTDELDIPYLIPNDDMPRTLGSGAIPAKFCAKGTSSPFSGLFPAFGVKLAPGEAVVVPGELSLYVGDADQQSFPRIEALKKGLNWIVQPITIHPLISAEIAALEAETSRIQLTITDRNGKVSQRSVAEVPARSGGTRLYAKIRLDMGTLDDTPVGNANKAAQGKVGAVGDTASGNGAPERAVLDAKVDLSQEEARMLDAFSAGVYHAEFELTVTLPNHKTESLKSRMSFSIATAASKG